MDQTRLPYTAAPNGVEKRSWGRSGASQGINVRDARGPCVTLIIPSLRPKIGASSQRVCLCCVFRSGGGGTFSAKGPRDEDERFEHDRRALSLNHKEFHRSRMPYLPIVRAGCIRRQYLQCRSSLPLVLMECTFAWLLSQPIPRCLEPLKPALVQPQEETFHRSGRGRNAQKRDREISRPRTNLTQICGRNRTALAAGPGRCLRTWAIFISTYGGFAFYPIFLLCFSFSTTRLPQPYNSHRFAFLHRRLCCTRTASCDTRRCNLSLVLQVTAVTRHTCLPLGGSLAPFGLIARLCVSWCVRSRQVVACLGSVEGGLRLAAANLVGTLAKDSFYSKSIVFPEAVIPAAPAGEDRVYSYLFFPP